MALAMIGKGRAVRECDACGGVDDHPRHTFAGDPSAYPQPDPELVEQVLANCEAAGVDGITRGRILRDLMSTASLTLHMDCCRDRGCPTGACDLVTAGAEDKRGGALLKHLVAQPQRVTDTDGVTLVVAE